MARSFIRYVNEFWKSKFHKTNVYDKYDIFSYSSSTGKFGHSNLLSEIKIECFSPLHYVVWEVLLSRVEQSRDYVKSGVVKFVYADYSEYCSNKTFYEAKEVFLREKLLLPTPNYKYFILNPLYINKFYKIKKFSK
jgi:capsule polysaccharide export protein KpsC/LpsZ